MITTIANAVYNSHYLISCVTFFLSRHLLSIWYNTIMLPTYYTVTLIAEKKVALKAKTKLSHPT